MHYWLYFKAMCNVIHFIQQIHITVDDDTSSDTNNEACDLPIHYTGGVKVTMYDVCKCIA